MKVVLINLGRKGGGPVYSIEVARALKEKVDLMCVISCQVENLDKWRELGVKLIEVNTYYDKLSFVFSTLNLKKFWQLRQNIVAWKPDLIYIPMLHTWTVLINHLLKKIPIVSTAHDPRPHLGEESIFTQLTNKIVYKQSKRIIILSKAFKEDMKRQNVSGSAIDVIPHGEFSYYTKEKNKIRPVFHNTILFFGRISKYKGIEVLLEAYKIIKKQNSETKLLIVGNGDMSAYQKITNSLENIEVVNRWIADEEVSSFFDVADFVVVPYIDASQSGVIPLAYGAGLPVIASRIGGLPEQVDDGITGILVNPGKAEELAEKCLYLINNKEVLAQMGKNAKQKATEDLSWDKVGELLIKSFKKAVQ